MLIAVHPAGVRAVAEGALCQTTSLVAIVEDAALLLLVPRRDEVAARQEKGLLFRVLGHAASAVAPPALWQHQQLALLGAFLLLDSFVSVDGPLAPLAAYGLNGLGQLLCIRAGFLLHFSITQPLLQSAAVVLAV